MQTDQHEPTDQQSPPDSERYRVFHQQGRWAGLPLRVEETGEPPRFERVGGADDGPDVLMLGLPNEGMMAGQPTNVVLLGYLDDEALKLTLVDTGARESWEYLLTALDTTGVPPERIGQIVLTHCHPDHIGNAAALKEATGAPVFAHLRERQQIERFGNGVEIDHWMAENEPIACDGFRVETIFTPGHSPGHYCVLEPESGVLVAGDMLSGFGSVGIFPPHGSMRAYIDSLRRLLAVDERQPFSLACPGHGPVIANPRAKIEEYIEHRLQREEEVFAVVRDGHATIDAMLPVIYPDVQPHLSFAARSTLQAHLDKLAEDGRIRQTASTRYTVN
jgi:glyoxylase-like metal-dependent hydrolase (beta-lactamase superfamily II)